MPKRLTLALAAVALAGFGLGTGASAQTAAPTPAGEPSSWQCAQFARMFSGIEIFGDAWTWWSQALGKYARGLTPQSGSVLVFKPSGAIPLGHVAVVQQVLTDRVIQVTHANWSPVGGQRGQIENNVTVVDVSPAGDWSQVKVWYRPRGDLGSTVYPTYGFIYKTASDAFSAAKTVAVSPFDAAARAALAAQVQDALALNP